MHVYGDDFSVFCKIKCPTEGDSRREVTIDTSNSGVTHFEIKRFWTVSVIGLFSLPVNVKKNTSVLILPKSVKPANTMALQQGTHLRPKPGGGFSEEHDIRMYRPGDPVKSIHWKISAKFNSIAIREPLVPPPHSRLVHVIKWKNASERDLILGRLRWVCEYMMKWQMPFYVKYDNESEIAEVKEVSDLTDYLSNILSAKHGKKSGNSNESGYLPSRFSWIFRIDAGSDTRSGLNKRGVARK